MRKVAHMVPSVLQAAAILRLLGAAAGPMGVSEVARALGLGPSSCFNILKTLTAQDLTSFDPVTKRYKLGLGHVYIARRALEQDAVIVAARPVMQQLALEFDCSVAIWRLVGSDRAVLTATADAEAATRIHMVIGHRQPLAAGAMGRAFMAALDVPDDRLLQAFQQVRWQCAPTFDDYRVQVRVARKRGFAVDTDNMFEGITTIAAAIRASGPIKFCLSASVFSRQVGKQGIQRMGQRTAAATAQIAARTSG